MRSLLDSIPKFNDFQLVWENLRICFENDQKVKKIEIGIQTESDEFEIENIQSAAETVETVNSLDSIKMETNGNEVITFETGENGDKFPPGFPLPGLSPSMDIPPNLDMAKSTTQCLSCQAKFSDTFELIDHLSQNPACQERYSNLFTLFQMYINPLVPASVKIQDIIMNP